VVDQSYLYQVIAEAIRQEILRGELRPGDRMPTVRQMTERWGCTPGTVQRAYHELAQRGLVASRRGRGTVVVGAGPQPAETPLRRAGLANRAEGFLLEAVAAGFTIDEIEHALTHALDRWRSASRAPEPAPPQALRFVGSHDFALDWLAAHFDEIAPGYRMEVRFTGSLGGLMALAAGEADLAGSHLWDAETGSYNEAFVRRLLPGRRVALITLARRRMGLIVATGNPHRVRSLRDIARSSLRFVNRQPGSGTRVWFDAQLQKKGIPVDQITGYERTESTHSAVARRIAEGEADVGLGLESAAAAYGLGFVHLTSEPYELVVPAEGMERPPIRRLAAWLKSRKANTALSALGGYETGPSGTLTWLG
jgi:molybdate-binding protein/DNA-binding transcriptional regulator YhcF (GntR family)